MKMGIVAMGAIAIALLGLCAILALDDFRLRQQLYVERQQTRKEISTATADMRDKVATASNQVIAARTEMARLNNELVFPIHITQKKMASGNGYTVQVFNNSDQTVPVTVMFTNATSKRSKNFDFELSPGFSREIGRMDGWTAASGD